MQNRTLACFLGAVLAIPSLAIAATPMNNSAVTTVVMNDSDMMEDASMMDESDMANESDMMGDSDSMEISDAAKDDSNSTMDAVKDATTMGKTSAVRGSSDQALAGAQSTTTAPVLLQENRRIMVR